ncbi:MAG: glycosyltransferase family 25 protein [Paracoccus sp.]|nr:glycosyltransferase family 25 protein [Paracoccus sp. (in: a-proteobacteria)]
MTTVPSDAGTVLPLSGRHLAVYLINMAGAQARLTAMQAQLAALDLPFTRIEGVDGRALTFPIPEFDERAYRLLHGRRTTSPEVGCYLSHVACARAFLDSGADLALILEDDVSFDADLIGVLDRAAVQGAWWNLLRLTSVNRGRKYAVRDLGQGRRLALALTREKGAGAYVIDRRAAQWIVTDLMPMRLAWDIAFDLEYLDGLRAAFVDPLPASQRSDHPTQIQAGLRAYKLGRSRYLTVLPYRAWLEAARLACRGTRLIRARLGLGPQPTQLGGTGQQA